jgi:hypothetical protein
MDRFLVIRSTKFPILPGEKEELFNEGTCGKALAGYLQSKLRERGYDCPFICCEDWGWWVELRAPFTFGVCVYSEQAENPVRFVCACDPEGGQRWSWSRFRFVDTSRCVERLREDLVAIFQSDVDVQLDGMYDQFPL